MNENIEKQAIEEMAKFTCNSQRSCYEGDCIGSKICAVRENCEKLYNAGYRKQSVVIDDFAERLKEKMDDLSRMEYNGYTYFIVGKAFIDKIAEEMKGGAE